MSESTIYFGQGYQKYFDDYYYKHVEHDAQYADPKSYYNLAEYYRNNDEGDKAQEYYKKAYDVYDKYSKIGEPIAYYYLGYFYQYGYGVKEDRAKAEEYYKKAYDQLSKYETKPEYQYLLGKIFESGYSNGKIGNPDYEKASYYYSMAASMHYVDAYYRLGYVDAMKKFQTM